MSYIESHLIGNIGDGLAGGFFKEKYDEIHRMFPVELREVAIKLMGKIVRTDEETEKLVEINELVKDVFDEIMYREDRIKRLKERMDVIVNSPT